MTQKDLGLWDRLWGNRGGGGGQPAPTVVPLAPTVTPINGNAQGTLRVVDDPASLGVRRYSVYRATTPGGAQTWLGYSYNKDDIRLNIPNGTTYYIQVASENVIGEGAKCAEFAISAAASNNNPARLCGVEMYLNTLWYEPIFGDYKAGSTFTVASSDGATISTVVNGAGIIAYGTFASTGAKTLTFTENLQAGGTYVSTQVVQCVARPAVGNVAATAAAIKARMNAKPTYSNGSITVTDNGGTLPGGYTASKLPGIDYHGKSIPGLNRYAAIGGFAPAANQVSTYDPYDPFAQFALQEYNSRSNAANNSVLRIRIFKQSFVVRMAASPTVTFHWKARYSDDNMATWTEMADPIYVKAASGSHHFVLDAGIAAPGGGRIWEVEASLFSTLQQNASLSGFGFLSGETPQAVVDTSPRMMTYCDSFANGSNGMDQMLNMGRVCARQLGLLNLWNMAVPTHRYTRMATSTFPLAINRIGKNVLGIGDLNMAPDIKLFAPNFTINDNIQTDATLVAAMIENFLLKCRSINPHMLIVLSFGLWNPTDYPSSTLYNAFKAGFNAAKDAGMYFNDGRAAGWEVPSGPNGSSIYFPKQVTANITASMTGKVLTVTATNGILERGLFLMDSTATTNLICRVAKQLTGTPGGTGDYEMDVSTAGGDFASGSYVLHAEGVTATNVSHPNDLGQAFKGGKMADGTAILVNTLVP